MTNEEKSALIRKQRESIERQYGEKLTLFPETSCQKLVSELAEALAHESIMLTRVSKAHRELDEAVAALKRLVAAVDKRCANERMEGNSEIANATNEARELVRRLSEC